MQIKFLSQSWQSAKWSRRGEKNAKGALEEKIAQIEDADEV